MASRTKRKRKRKSRRGAAAAAAAAAVVAPPMTLGGIPKVKHGSLPNYAYDMVPTGADDFGRDREDAKPEEAVAA